MHYRRYIQFWRDRYGYGAALGAVFMEVITNSLTLMKISVYWQNLFYGVILIAAVLLDQYKRALMMRQSVKTKE